MINFNWQCTHSSVSTFLMLLCCDALTNGDFEDDDLLGLLLE